MRIVSYDKCCDSRSAASERGFVLITVLWMLALLALLGAAFSTIARLDTKSKANIVHKAELQLLADGLARYFAVVAARPTSKLSVDGRTSFCSLRDYPAAYAVSDVAGLVDLNATSADTLSKLLMASGASSISANEIAARVLDFRDGDDARTAGGAEAEDYLAAGRPHVPKNSPFETVSELDQVLGMTPSIFVRIAPFLTVHSRRPEVDVSIAPVQILKALASAAAPEAQVERVYQQRDPLQRAALGGRAFSITAMVWGRDGSNATRSTVIEVSPNDPRGYTLREWNERTVVMDPSDAPSVKSPPCF